MSAEDKHTGPLDVKTVPDTRAVERYEEYDPYSRTARAERTASREAREKYPPLTSEKARELAFRSRQR